MHTFKYASVVSQTTGSLAERALECIFFSNFCDMIRYYPFLVAVIVISAASSNDGKLLEDIFNFIKPLILDSVVVISNDTTSLENVKQKLFDTEDNKNETFVSKYHVTDESSNASENGQKVFHFIGYNKKPTTHVEKKRVVKPVVEPPKKYPKLSNFFPKQKIILLTSTLVFHKTIVNTIYRSCLRLENVHSICEGYLKTVIPTKSLPSGNIWKSESLKNNTNENEFIEYTSGTPFVNPTAAIPIEMTTAVRPDQQNSTSIYAESSINDEFVLFSEQLAGTQAATPELITSSEDTVLSHMRILPHLLSPKIVYKTEFLYVTKTQNYYDHSHTATIIAQNCLPLEVKNLSRCPPQNPSFVSKSSSWQKYEPTLPKEDQYFFLSLLPSQHIISEVQHESTSSVAIENPIKPETHDQILNDGIRRIREKIHQYVIASGNRVVNGRVIVQIYGPPDPRHQLITT